MTSDLTGRNLILGAFKGTNAGSVPVWFMRQAGRYLPEYMEIRNKYTFEERCQTPELAAKITLQPIERFDMDAAIIFSDILVPIYGMKRGLEIIPERGPIISNPIKSPQDIDELLIPSSKSDFPYVSEAINKVRSEIPNKALFGFSGAPFTLASYLLEGKSTRDALITKSFALKYPEAFDKLLTLLTDIILDQLQSQIASGADLVQVFDSWAGFLSAEQFQKWSFPYLKRIFDNIKDVPTLMYSRGSNHLFQTMTQLGSDGISIDHTLSIAHARKTSSPKLVLQGNLDPAYLLTNPKLVKKQTQSILKSVTSPYYIFNLARGIDRNSSLEAVRAMVDEVKSFRM
ncbi:MAG: uroporphyrinogen decarboxylase [Candidatus Kariarchaeaceae archaeon]|jgi:uroporphyrinogen decarboxylase